VGDVLYLAAIITFLALMVGSVLAWDRMTATEGSGHAVDTGTAGSRSPGPATTWSA